MALSGVGDRIMSRQLVELTTAEGCSISHIAAGTMIWAGRVVTIPFLSNHHELLPWLRRCLDLYGGVGAHLALHAFPGLPPTEIRP
jgi:hypothetical protein